MLSLRNIFRPRENPQTPESIIDSTRNKLSKVLGNFLPSLKPLEQAKKWVLKGLKSLGIFEDTTEGEKQMSASPLPQEVASLENSLEMSRSIADSMSEVRLKAGMENTTLQLPEASESPALTALAERRLREIFVKDPVPDGQLASLHEQSFLREHQVFENIARGFESPEQAMESWIQSDQHYRAMLSDADHYGVAVMKNPKDHKWYAMVLFQKEGKAPILAPEGLPKYSVQRAAKKTEEPTKESSDEPSSESGQTKETA